MAGTLELCFLRDAIVEKRLGPYRALRFEGEVLRAEAGGPVIARHEHHEWRMDGDRFPRLQVEGCASVHFERVDGTHSQDYGAESVSFIDGVAYVDHHIFAFVDRSIVDWYCHEDEQHWPLMVLAATQ